jgi:hypothetical protein
MVALAANGWVGRTAAADGAWTVAQRRLQNAGLKPLSTRSALSTA